MEIDYNRQEPDEVVIIPQTVTTVRANDTIVCGSDTVTLYGTEVRRGRKNELIQFTEPLLGSSSIAASMYNLQRIKTTFMIRGWVDDSAFSHSGFTTANTLDAIMGSTSTATFTWRGTAVYGYITDYVIIEQPENYKMQMSQVEITFEEGKSI